MIARIVRGLILDAVFVQTLDRSGKGRLMTIERSRSGVGAKSPGPWLSVTVCCAAIVLCGGAFAEPKALTPADLAVLNRVSWGVSGASAAEMARLGPDRWLEEQLHPPKTDRLPAAAQARIDALTISKVPFAEIVADETAQRTAVGQFTDTAQRNHAQEAYKHKIGDLANQAMERMLLRDLYSPDQLKEQMTWFWLNHFSVYQYKKDIRAMLGDYEDRAIRPHALGRFRDLVEASLRHPVMLRYLDNFESQVDHVNENYARELMELHTMGVGSGYTQKDVEELARILTGVSYNVTDKTPDVPQDKRSLYIRDGLFEFNPVRHDFGDKVFLGHTIRGSGYHEVEEALDILCREPATARRISSKLATDFVSDDPPPALVERMAKTFQSTDGDISAVLGVMFRSPEFRASLGGKFKDPIHYVVSAVRFAYDDKVVLNTDPMMKWATRMAEGLFNHDTPDGYPITSAAWTGSGQMEVRFEVAREIGSGPAGLFTPKGQSGSDAEAGPKLQNALYEQGVARTLGAPTRNALQQAVSTEDWNTLFLSSPEFMRR
jgi:uncharacterized protein (DUF1800 family)